MFELQVNGDLIQVPDPTTVTSLLGILELQDRKVAVEVNREIIPRSQHTSHRLGAGDQVEIVHAIGGG